MSALAVALGWQQVCTCCECGIEFASPIIAKRRDDGEWFYCPNGHRQHFTKTEAARLREELQRKESQLAQERRNTEWYKSQYQTTEKRLSAQRGQTTKAKNQLKRVKNGVCPCCNRTFQNLMRHMDTKHPNYCERR